MKRLTVLSLGLVLVSGSFALAQDNGAIVLLSTDSAYLMKGTSGGLTNSGLNTKSTYLEKGFFAAATNSGLSSKSTWLEKGANPEVTQSGLSTSSVYLKKGTTGKASAPAAK